MKFTAKNKEKAISKKGIYYILTAEELSEKNKDVIQLNKELNKKHYNLIRISNNLEEMKKDLQIKEKLLEEEKNLYFERYTRYTETKESIEHEFIQDSQNEELQRELLGKILAMKEKTTNKIELVGLKEKEVKERENKLNKELESLSTEDFEEFKRFEEEILNLNSSKIEEELKKNRIDVSKLEDLNLESCILDFQSTITLLKNSKKSKSMGDILKIKNKQESKIGENILKNSIDNNQIHSDIQYEKMLNKQYEILLTDLKNLEDTAKKNYNNQENSSQNAPSEVYVKSSRSKVSINNQKLNKTEYVSKEKTNKNKVTNVGRNLKPKEEEKVNILESNTLSGNEGMSSNNPVHNKHKRTESSPQTSSHMQASRENKKHSPSQMKTEPNPNNVTVLTSSINNTDIPLKTQNDICFIKQANIEGVKTNRTFHLLRNKRIQDLIDSNLIITMDAIGGENCCKRLKKNYDINISISNSKIQQSEQNRLNTYREGHLSPLRNKSSTPKNIPRSKTTTKYEVKAIQEEEKNEEKRDLSVSQGRFKKKAINKTMKDVNIKRNMDNVVNEANEIINAPHNLITFNNNDVLNDKKQSNHLSKFVNNNHTTAKSKASNPAELIVKPAKIETIKINSNKKAKAGSSMKSTSKKSPKNEKLNSKLFNNDGDNELNRSRTSMKSGGGSKKNLELKSKIFNDTQDTKNNKTILNISPIKKESSLDNISKAEKHNKTISTHFLNNMVINNRDERVLEDSKFTDFENKI